MRIQEITARSIITPTRLPGADVVVNPYVGCTFACTYCFASFMGRFVGEPVEAWGDYLYVKTNAVELFESEVVRLQRRNPRATLLMSSVTDPWQGPEKKYRLTRGILRELARVEYLGQVSLLTKSPLLLRDLDLLTDLHDVEVGVTITAPDDLIGWELEARAPPIRRRFDILRACNRARLPTYAFLGPLLPHFRERPEALEAMFQALADTGTTTVFAEKLNTSPYIRRRLSAMLATAPANVKAAYADDEASSVIEGYVLELVHRHGFELRLGTVIDHRANAPAAAIEVAPSRADPPSKQKR